MGEAREVLLVFPGRWRGKSPERVVDEMEWLLRRFPGTKILDPVDDNFFVDRKRAQAICELILSCGLKFRWRANCRFDYLARYDAEFLGLVERAGCRELDFGGESGSARFPRFCRDYFEHAGSVQTMAKLPLEGGRKAA